MVMQSGTEISLLKNCKYSESEKAGDKPAFSDFNCYRVGKLNK